jgi:hypothetical protein
MIFGDEMIKTLPNKIFLSFLCLQYSTPHNYEAIPSKKALRSTETVRCTGGENNVITCVQ